MSNRLLLVVAEGWHHLVRHPLRSALTAATCAVAIAVTVNVISLSYGMDEDIRHDLVRFGRMTIDVGRSPFVSSKSKRAPFGETELEQVRTIVKGLDAVVVPLRTANSVVKGLGTQEGSQGKTDELDEVALAAVTPDYPQTLSIELAAGRWFRADEKGFSACVIDESVARAVFPKVSLADVPGRRVVISAPDPHDVPVVGVLADPMTYRALFDVFDAGRESRPLVSRILAFRNVYVPEDAIPTAELTLVHVVLPDDRRLFEARRRLESVWSSAATPVDILHAPAINVFTRRTWIDAFSGLTQSSALLGNFIWILICLVACVMISTLHLVTIRERYDELAVRRCEGARRSDIVLQVATEGLVTSVVGGLLGLPFGILGADVLRAIVGFPFRFELPYAAAALGVAVVLGLVSAAVPARRAASLDPAAVLSRRLS
jgi:putative ABC transport system permease protein